MTACDPPDPSPRVVGPPDLSAGPLPNVSLRKHVRVLKVSGRAVRRAVSQSDRCAVDDFYAGRRAAIRGGRVSGSLGKSSIVDSLSSLAPAVHSGADMPDSWPSLRRLDAPPAGAAERP